MVKRTKPDTWDPNVRNVAASRYRAARGLPAKGVAAGPLKVRITFAASDEFRRALAEHYSASGRAPREMIETWAAITLEGTAEDIVLTRQEAEEYEHGE